MGGVVISYDEGVTSFFQEYLLFPKDNYHDDGTLTDGAMRTAARVLLENGVFDSPKGMVSQALRDHSVMLPISLFEKEN